MSDMKQILLRWYESCSLRGRFTIGILSGLVKLKFLQKGIEYIKDKNVKNTTVPVKKVKR